VSKQDRCTLPPTCHFPSPQNGEILEGVLGGMIGYTLENIEGDTSYVGDGVSAGIPAGALVGALVGAGVGSLFHR